MKDNIFLFETAAQKKIVQKLINDLNLSVDDYTVFDCSGHNLKFDNYTFIINFNKISLLNKSLINIFKLKKIIDFKCKKFYSTQFTGINALFWSSIFEAENYILIDDGIGTPVIIIDNQIYDSLWKFRIRFNIIRFVLKLFHNIKLFDVKSTLKKINVYYSLYYKFFEDKQIPYTLCPVKKLYSITKVAKNVNGFIGAPMIEFGLINKDFYISILKKIISKYGDLNYYPHPDEKEIYSLKDLQGLHLYPNKSPLEFYFQNNSVPDKIFSFSSSCALNIAVCCDEIEIYDIEYESFSRTKSSIYSRVLGFYGVNKIFKVKKNKLIESK